MDGDVPSEDIFFETRVKFWLIAVGVTVLVTLGPLVLFFGSVAIELIPLFPAGLALLFGDRANTDDRHFIAMGWAVYAVLTIALLAARTRRLYFTIFALFCFVLAANIVGCYGS